MNTDDLPIYTHETVLGVDIGVWQRAHEKEQQGEEIEGAGYGVDVNRAYVDRLTSVRDRRYMASWIRRNWDRL